jgi:HPt (histidine-containing phosphotransfer) domain-containing protein
MRTVTAKEAFKATLAPEGGESQKMDRLLDLDVTLTRFAGDETLLSEIAGVFTRTVPQLVDSISVALTANDLSCAFQQAHSLKGAVAAFEAPAVLSSVVELERYAKNNDAAGAAVAFPVAQALVSRLLTELATIMQPEDRVDTQA